MWSCCTSWEIRLAAVTVAFDEPAVGGAADSVLVGTKVPRNAIAIDEINPNRGIDRLLETMDASVANGPSPE